MIKKNTQITMMLISNGCIKPSDIVPNLIFKSAYEKDVIFKIKDEEME
jgi:hypothetical protein